MVRTEFCGSGYKAVLLTKPINPEPGGSQENNLKTGIFGELSEQGAIRYLKKLYENIATDSAEFVVGVEKIYGSAYLDELKNWVHESYPNAAFKVENVSNEPSLEDITRLRQHADRLLSEKEELNIKYDQRIKDLNKQRDEELKSAKIELEKSYHMELSKLRPVLKNSCIEILQDVIKERFQFSEDMWNTSNSEVGYSNARNNEVTSSTRLIDSNHGHVSKDLKKLFDEVLDDIQKVYEKKMDRLKIYLKTKKEKEFSEVKRRVIEVLDLRDISNTTDNAVNSVTSVNPPIQEPRANSLESGSRSDCNLTTSNNNSILTRNGEVTERGHELKDHVKSSLCDIMMRNDPIAREDIKAEPSVISDIEYESCSLEITDDSCLTDNEIRNEQDEQELKDPLEVCPSFHIIDLDVEDIEMTEDKAEALLRELPIEQADSDSYVFPFPIADEIFTDEYWANEWRQNKQKEVQKLIKKFVLKYKSLQKKLSPEDWLIYEEYRRKNRRCCWEVKCLLRNKRFPTKNHFFAHVNKYHPNGRTIFPCHVCSLPFQNNEMLKEHFNQHHSKYMVRRNNEKPGEAWINNKRKKGQFWNRNKLKAQGKNPRVCLKKLHFKKGSTPKNWALIPEESSSQRIANS